MASSFQVSLVSSAVPDLVPDPMIGKSLTSLPRTVEQQDWQGQRQIRPQPLFQSSSSESGWDPRHCNRVVRRIHVALNNLREIALRSRSVCLQAEMGLWSTTFCEREICASLSTLKAEEVLAIEYHYKVRCGEDLDVALYTSCLSPSIRKVVGIYRKGRDYRSDDDIIELISISLRQCDFALFQEIVSQSTQTARERFMNNDGYTRIAQAFGLPVTGFDGQRNCAETNYFKRARELMEFGKLSTATQINDLVNGFGAQSQLIEGVLSSMSEMEKQEYNRGRETLQRRQSAYITSADIKAARVYESIIEALFMAGDEKQVIEWESKFMR